VGLERTRAGSGDAHPRTSGVRGQQCDPDPQNFQGRLRALVHPATGATLEVVAPVPVDLAELIAAAGLATG
jgi:hypothetical protein